MALVLDELTRTGYVALASTTARAAYVLSTLVDPVVVEVYDGLDVLRASGQMAAPWATQSGGSLVIGELDAVGLTVAAGGVPTADWYCQFRSGARLLRGTFGLVGSGRDFVWSLPTFETGSRGTIGAAVVTASGQASSGNQPPVWQAIPTIQLYPGEARSIAGYASDPDGDPMTFTRESGTFPSGVTMDPDGTIRAALSAAPILSGDIVVGADDGVSAGAAPVNTVAPTITGTASVNSTLSASPGTWSGSPAPAYTYQWLRGGVAISAATGAVYMATSADIGSSLSVRVTATNSAGSAFATSAPTSVVGAGGAGPLSTTFTITSAAGGSNLPLAFGHAFRQGDVPAGQVALGAASGLSSWQCSPTTYWPDGSVRHAIVAGRCTLTANVAKSIALTAGADPGGAALTTADLAAASPNVTVTVGGTTLTLSSVAASPHRTVCAGPVMSNWIYRLAVAGSAHLVIWLDVRLYAGGAIEVFPWVESAYLTVANPASTVGTACQVSVGGSSVFSQSINVAHHSRVALVSGSAFSYWSITDPQITPQHDAAYLRSTRMVPNYGALTVAAGTMSGLLQTFTPNTRAGVGEGMGAAGGSGALLGWYGLPAQSIYCINADARAYRASVVFGLSSGSWSVHYRDEATNEPFRFDLHADKTTNVGGTIVPAGSGATNGTHAPTHLPSFAYLPWLLTGRWFFLEEQLFWCGSNYLNCRPDSRRGETSYQTGPYLFPNGGFGVVDPRTGSWSPRGAAWGVNALAQAFAILPTDHTCYGSIKRAVESTAEFYRKVFVSGSHAPGWVSPLGILGSYSSSGLGYDISPPVPPAGSTYWWDAGWQHGMQAQSWGRMRELALNVSSTAQADIDQVAAHIGKFPAGLAGDGSAGNWNYRRFVVYAFPIGQDANGLPLESYTQTFGEALAEYERELGSLSSAAAQPLVQHSSNVAYTAQTTSFTYGGQLLAGLAFAADWGVPGASAGWSRLSGSPSWAAFQADFAIDPTYNIVPRA